MQDLPVPSPSIAGLEMKTSNSLDDLQSGSRSPSVIDEDVKVAKKKRKPYRPGLFLF